MIGIITMFVMAFIGIWIAGEAFISRTNPPGRHSGTILSPHADEMLRRACFDCHSNETRYPAYSYLPGASLLMAMHIREGRRELNFSDWDRFTPKARREALEESLETIRKGSMPTWDYVLLHPQARLSNSDVVLVEQAASVLGARAGGGKEQREWKEERD
jgi:hypothetical protein